MVSENHRILCVLTEIRTGLWKIVSSFESLAEYGLLIFKRTVLDKNSHSIFVQHPWQSLGKINHQSGAWNSKRRRFRADGSEKIVTVLGLNIMTGVPEGESIFSSIPTIRFGTYADKLPEHIVPRANVWIIVWLKKAIFRVNCWALNFWKNWICFGITKHHWSKRFSYR